MSNKEPYWMRDAEWWEFWMPQSGFIGGAIMAIVIVSFVAAIFTATLLLV